MSPIKNLVRERKILRYCLAALVVVAACGTDSSSPDASGACVPPQNSTAPTYSDLYTRYFATGTPGHCANTECHADDRNGWACGPNKNTCYAGMVGIGIINTADPKASTIGDPRKSPLNWVNVAGPMPQDAVMPFPEGRDAILAWVAACAQNN